MAKLTKKFSTWLRNVTGAEDVTGVGDVTEAGLDSDEMEMQDPAERMEIYSQFVSDKIQSWREEPPSREPFDISDLDLDSLSSAVIVELQAVKLEEYQTQRALLEAVTGRGDGNAACSALLAAKSALFDANTLLRKLSEEDVGISSRSAWRGPQQAFVTQEIEMLNLFEGLVEPIISDLEERSKKLRERYAVISDMVEDIIDEMQMENKKVLKDEEIIKSIRRNFNTAEQTFTEMKARTDNLPDRARLRRAFPALADRYDAINTIFGGCNFMVLARQINREINPNISLGI